MIRNIIFDMVKVIVWAQDYHTLMTDRYGVPLDRLVISYVTGANNAILRSM